MKLTIQKLKKAVSSALRPRARDYLHSELMCEVEKCTSLYGFGFREDDWHYLASTMRQLISSPSIPAEETWLWRYFQKFQPRNMFEALYDRDPDDQQGFGVLARYRDPERGPMPWTPEAGLTEERLTASFLGDYGPWPEDMIRNRLRRIAAVVEAIRRDGYRHDKLGDPDDCIRGVMVKHANDWRMVIIGGNHRASALSALGHTSIPVQSHRHLPAVLDIAMASQWPVVRMGVLDRKVAQDIALRYFTVTGRGKAEKWGIP